MDGNSIAGLPCSKGGDSCDEVDDTKKVKTPLAFHRIRCILRSHWVRKLIGKPAFLTIADCESEARRIQSHAAVFSPFATKSNAFRTHSEVVSLERRMASAIAEFSSGESLACIRIPRSFDFGFRGLPSFFFIKTLCMTKILVDIVYFSSYV